MRTGSLRAGQRLHGMDLELTTRYALSKPAASHRRTATCAEVSCKHYLNGWQIHVEVGAPEYDRVVAGVMQSGRRFTRADRVPGWSQGVRREMVAQQSRGIPVEEITAWLAIQDKAPHTVFTFEAGQTCFGRHTAPNDRPALYVVRQGGVVHRHVNPADWVDDFATHLDKIREQ